MVDSSPRRLGEGFFPGRALVPAYLELRDEELLWWLAPGGLPVPPEPQFVEPAGMLDAFVRIRTADGVLRFARRFGVLGLCEHHLPASPSPMPARFHGGTARGCTPRGWDERLCREPIGDWLCLVAQARAMLSIAAAIHCRETPSREDWAVLVNTGVLTPHAGKDRALDRRYLAAAVQWWLLTSRLGFWFEWRGEDPEVGLFASTFDHLTAQLVNAISRSYSMAICDACGLPYRAQRQPRTDRRNYCRAPECQREGARLRKRNSRGR